MIDLNPCPCCGHRAELREERTDYGIVWSITCVYCGLMIVGGDKQTVIDAWQRRRTDGMIAWLDAEIEKHRTLNDVPGLHAVNRRSALIDCKKQLLKLLDWMGFSMQRKMRLVKNDCTICKGGGKLAED